MGEDLRTMDDAGLAQRIAAGDDSALAVVYDRYATPAFSLALRLVGDPQAAADVVQRAFARVWDESARFDPARGRLSTWLLSIVNYLAAGPAALRAAPVPVAGGRRET